MSASLPRQPGILILFDFQVPEGKLRTLPLSMPPFVTKVCTPSLGNVTVDVELRNYLSFLLTQPVIYMELHP